jgi:hypothetical protein
MLSARRILIAVTSSSALLLAATASPAEAKGPVVKQQQTCAPAPLSHPFARWGDNSSYHLAPGGDFLSQSWTLKAGARFVPGGAPATAAGVSTSTSVLLPASGSVTSPLMCLDATEPTMRFFIEGTGDVVAQIVDNGIPVVARIVPAGVRWLPSPLIETAASQLGLLSGGTAQVSVRITGLSGAPRVDDIFIDPWNRG